jgi:hypothetical protein
MSTISSFMLNNLQLKGEVAKRLSQISDFVTMTEKCFSPVIMVECHVSVHV